MKYEITHTTKYAYTDAVPVCHNIVHLRPRDTQRQKCRGFRMLIHPEPFDLANDKDSFNNNEAYFSIEQAHLGLTITAVSQVEVLKCESNRPDTSSKPAQSADEALLPFGDDAGGEDGRSCERGSDEGASDMWTSVVEKLARPSPDVFEVLPFAYPTASTRSFPELHEYAAASFVENRPIREAAMELTSRIHADFEYDPRATNISTPLSDVFKDRRGVCQDFAHLQLACFRSLGLAARYVSGYLRTYPPPGHVPLRGADASHAWVSVYCGDAGWMDLDPTNAMIPSTDHVTVAWGRDYADVCPVRGVILGGGTHRMSVSVDVHALEAEPPLKR